MDFLTQEIDVFADTQQLCELSPTLKKGIQATIKGQEIIVGTTSLVYPMTLDLKYATSDIYGSAVEGIVENEAVLQFISPISPAKITSLKQSEDIPCDCTIFPCLSKLMEAYFDKHKDLTTPYNDDCIYSPEVTFFKKRGTLVSMPKWKKAAVISATLPDTVDKEIILARLERMIEVARSHQHTSILINSIQEVNLDDVYEIILAKYQSHFFHIDIIK